MDTADADADVVAVVATSVSSIVLTTGATSCLLWPTGRVVAGAESCGGVG